MDAPRLSLAQKSRALGMRLEGQRSLAQGATTQSLDVLMDDARAPPPQKRRAASPEIPSAACERPMQRGDSALAAASPSPSPAPAASPSAVALVPLAPFAIASTLASMSASFPCRMPRASDGERLAALLREKADTTVVPNGAKFEQLLTFESIILALLHECCDLCCCERVLTVACTRTARATNAPLTEHQRNQRWFTMLSSWPDGVFYVDLGVRCNRTGYVCHTRFSRFASTHSHHWASSTCARRAAGLTRDAVSHDGTILFGVLSVMSRLIALPRLRAPLACQVKSPRMSERPSYAIFVSKFCSSSPSPPHSRTASPTLPRKC